jgi:hypothetical protein
MTTFAERLNELGICVTDFTTDLGISPTSFHQWNTRKAFPSKKYYQRILEYTDGKITPNDILMDFTAHKVPLRKNSRVKKHINNNDV